MNRKFRMYVMIFAFIFAMGVFISYMASDPNKNRLTVQDLHSPDPAVRKAAAEMLGETMSSTGMIMLNELAYSEQNKEVKAAMFEALEKIEKKRSKRLIQPKNSSQNIQAQHEAEARRAAGLD